MLGVDTNILVYCHRAETPEHARALKVLGDLARGSDLWAVAWPSFYEFLRVVTHPQIFSPPSTLQQALAFLTTIATAPTLRLLGHGPQHWDFMHTLLIEGDIRSNLVFDAQIAALLVENGVGEILTADGDFRRFRQLKVTNPI